MLLLVEALSPEFATLGPRAYYRIADPSLIALCREVCGGVRQSLAELSAIVGVPTTVQEE
jgi:hypothetical protein